jgi:hypothetical protein
MGKSLLMSYNSRILQTNFLIMPPLMIAGTALSMLPELYKTFQGIRQINQGKQGLAGLDRPEYSTPEAFKREMALSANAYANGTMPGETTMVDRANQSTANAFAQSTEAGNPFAMLAALSGQNQAAMQNIGVSSAQYQNQLQQQYQQMLGNYANYQDQEWQMNKFAPYKEKQQEYRDIYGAGQQNLYNGLSSLAGMGTRMMMPGLMQGSGTAAPGIDKAALDALYKQYSQQQSSSTMMPQNNQYERYGYDMTKMG